MSASPASTALMWEVNAVRSSSLMVCCELAVEPPTVILPALACVAPAPIELLLAC